MKFHPVAIATIAVIGTAAALVVSGASASNSTTHTTQMEVAQIQHKTFQRISRAAVLRSNQSLNYLAPIRTTTTDAVNTGKAGVTRLSSVVGSGLGWTTAQIANGAVTTAKIANGAVATAQIANGAVTNAKLANPIYVAQTTATGAISTLTPGVTAVLSSPGVNILTFTVPVGVAACTFAATIAGATPGFVTVSPSPIAGTAAAVTVETFNTIGAVLTLPVHIIAYC